MKYLICAVTAVILTFATTANAEAFQSQWMTGRANTVQDDPVSLGRPLSYWLKVIRDRNIDEIDMAYAAIVELGPAASAAVPELMRVVAEPFAPIQVGRDDKRETLSKLLNIFIRGGAIDSLGAIGEAAAPSTRSVIQWSLTIRVLPSEERTPADGLFVDLVAMDVLERMRGAGTIAQFGLGAAPAVLELMASPDGERRKFAVAILNEGSLPIVSDLMKSESCEERMLGFSVLADMWPVVSSNHLRALKEILACPENGPKSFAPTRSKLPVLD